MTPIPFTSVWRVAALGASLMIALPAVAQPTIEITAMSTTTSGTCDVVLEVSGEEAVFVFDSSPDLDTFPVGLVAFASPFAEEGVCEDVPVPDGSVPVCGPTDTDDEVFVWSFSLTVNAGQGTYSDVEYDGSLGEFVGEVSADFDCCGLAADFDGDGSVLTPDLLIFLRYYGLEVSGEDAVYDLDGNGIVNSGDV